MSFESATSSSHRTFVTIMCTMLKLRLMTDYMYRLENIPFKSIPDTFYLKSKHTKQSTFIYHLLNYNFFFTILTFIFQNSHYSTRRSCLRHCAISWKAAGSIPYAIIEIFYWHNPSDRSIALRPNQPLTEMSKGSRRVGLTPLPHSYADCLKIWEP